MSLVGVIVACALMGYQPGDKVVCDIKDSVWNYWSDVSDPFKTEDECKAVSSEVMKTYIAPNVLAIMNNFNGFDPEKNASYAFTFHCIDAKEAGELQKKYPDSSFEDVTPKKEEPKVLAPLDFLNR